MSTKPLAPRTTISFDGCKTRQEALEVCYAIYDESEDELVRTLAALWFRKTHTKLQQAFAALPEVQDLPGTLTERQRGAEIDRRARLPQFITSCGSLTEQLTKAVATLAEKRPLRDRLRSAKAAIEKQIAGAPDWRTLTGRERDKEWARQNGLNAALTAIHATIRQRVRVCCQRRRARALQASVRWR